MPSINVSAEKVTLRDLGRLYGDLTLCKFVRRRLPILSDTAAHLAKLSAENGIRRERFWSSHEERLRIAPQWFFPPSHRRRFSCGRDPAK